MTTTFWHIPKLNVKSLNKHAAIDLIRFTPGGISRIELSRQLSLTRAGVTQIVNDLIESGVVIESNGRHQGGRKPINLEINPNNGYVVGIDMGATHIILILADYQARVIKETEAPLDITQGPKVCLPQVDALMRTWLEQTGVSFSEVGAIGAGVPGPIVSEAGMVSAPPIMPGWDNFPIHDWMKEKWNVPVTLSNDAEVGALGEWAYGAGRGVSNLAYVKVGTGVGAGLLIDGQIYRGATGCAGEIGHITLNPDGPPCSCGNFGCLEAYAGGRAIAMKAIAAIRSGQRTTLAEIKPIQSITSRDVLAAGRRGDLLSQQIIREAGYYLGTAIASLVNLFNPSMIVIGGGVSQMGDLLLDPIRQEVLKRSLRSTAHAVRISVALLGRRSSGMGAVAQAISLSLHQMAEAN